MSETGSEKRSDGERRLALALRSIVGGHPFFGTLALFAHYELDDAVETAATDGATIRFAATFIAQLSQKQLESVLVHELLHCALDHMGRRGKRDARLWNVAADIVVNRMIREMAQYALPAGSIEDRYASERSVERVYEDLERHCDEEFNLKLIDLPSDTAGPSKALLGRKLLPSGYWKSALDEALVVARRIDSTFGSDAWPGWREVAQISAPQLSWREMLWRFVVRTPSDFSGFDRRYLWRGLYLDEMASGSMKIAIAIDTSASVSASELGSFMGEVTGILRAYPHLKGVLYFADAAVYGPHDIDDNVLSLRPAGGGGTSFVPFFEAIQSDLEGRVDLAIYFTDGEGAFPSTEPDFPVMWVVTSGGRSSELFPFGEAVRMTYA